MRSAAVRSESLDIALSPLDGERFGVRVARCPDVSAATLEGCLSFCEDERVDLLITRCSTAATETVAALQASGFAILDCLVHYRRSLEDLPPRFAPAGVRLRTAVETDADAIEAIAEICFTGYSGHYHADPRLSTEAATQVYASWARRAVTNPRSGTSTLVAELDGTVIAFLVLEVDVAIARASLAGVLPEHRSRRVLESLSVERLHRAVELGATTAVSSYLLTNTAVQRAAQNSGFRISHSEYTFHRWFDHPDGGPP